MATIRARFSHIGSLVLATPGLVQIRASSTDVIAQQFADIACHREFAVHLCA
jgi:hypothetical protein